MGLEDDPSPIEETTPAAPQTNLPPKTEQTGDSTGSEATVTPGASDRDCILTLDDTPTSPSAPPGAGGPAAPNQGSLIGNVRCVWQVQASSLNIQPEMPIFIAEVEIVETKDVQGFLNPLAGQEGQTITIFSTATIPPDAPGRVVEALVTFRGDERGAKYWIVGDQLSIR